MLPCRVDWKNIGRFDKKGNGVSNANLEHRDPGYVLEQRKALRKEFSETDSKSAMQGKWWSRS